MLDGYYREGEPLRLGLGLYPVNASASRYYAPFATGVRLSKMEVTASLPVQTVRLDSMSLFDVGQAPPERRLDKSAGGCAGNIRAKPGWLILVAGYTDATGDEKSNQQLSLRRAKRCATGCCRPATSRPPVLPYRDWARASLRRPTTRHRAGQSTGVSKSVLRFLTPVRREIKHTARSGASITLTRRVISLAIPPAYLWLKR